MDRTTALSSEDWQAVLDFLKSFIGGLGVSPAPDGARVGIIQFSSKPKTSLYFNTLVDNQLSPHVIKRFLDAIVLDQGSRRIDLALQHAAEDLFTARGGARPNAKRVIITLSENCLIILIRLG